MAFKRHSKIKTNEELTPQIKPQQKQVMGKTKEVFSNSEAAFIISKLRQAEYKGTEFETFYQIMAKLTKIAEK